MHSGEDAQRWDADGGEWKEKELWKKKKEKSKKKKKNASLRIEMREQATGSQELRVSVYLSPREH